MTRSGDAMMDRSLATNVSLWESPYPAMGKQVPPKVSHVQVCVIGAGIAGLTTAYSLAKEGLKVLVLEEREIGGGQTSKTTAHLASALDDRFSELERSRGEEASRVAAASHGAAIDRIESIVKTEKIDCEFRRVDGYLFAASPRDAKLIDQELEAAHRAGIKDARRLDEVPLPGANRGPCIQFPRQGRFHPLLYLQGLAQAIRRLGGVIATGCRVSEIESGEPAIIHIEQGSKIKADSVVVATNSPFNDRFVIHTKQAPYLTYAVAAPIPAGAIPDALYWDTLDPYHYVRLSSHDGQCYVIVGGEDHKTGQADDQELRFLNLERWGRELLPEMGNVERRWSGQVLETIDGLGFIGRNPDDSPNVFIATGDSGMGMTHGTIAGILLTDLIQGRENPWARFYDPSRSAKGALREFVRENANVALQYLDWASPGDITDPAVIPPGSGAVIRHGATKLALYRDENSRLHAFSAVCPHLGCIVAWNSATATWDCPCHGSRFDRLGEVVQGPSNKGLHPVDESEESLSPGHKTQTS